MSSDLDQIPLLYTLIEPYSIYFIEFVLVYVSINVIA